MRAFVLAALSTLAACGGDDVAIELYGLSAEAQSIVLQVHPSDRKCADLRAAGLQLVEIKALFQQRAVVSGGAVALDRIERIPAGTYTVAVVALDGNRTPIEAACEGDVRVRDGQVTAISLTLEPLAIPASN